MAETTHFVTNEQGQRICVLLDLITYDRLLQSPNQDPDFLPNLNNCELQALADSSLAPAAQSRLNALLAQNNENQLSEDQQTELEKLLNQIDSLNLLKTRARYTLQTLENVTPSA
jgi:hypothetical protein